MDPKEGDKSASQEGSKNVGEREKDGLAMASKAPLKTNGQAMAGSSSQACSKNEKDMYRADIHQYKQIYYGESNIIGIQSTSGTTILSQGWGRVGSNETNCQYLDETDKVEDESEKIVDEDVNATIMSQVIGESSGDSSNYHSAKESDDDDDDDQTINLWIDGKEMFSSKNEECLFMDLAKASEVDCEVDSTGSGILIGKKNDDKEQEQSDETKSVSPRSSKFNINPTASSSGIKRSQDDFGGQRVSPACEFVSCEVPATSGTGKEEKEHHTKSNSSESLFWGRKGDGKNAALDSASSSSGDLEDLKITSIYSSESLNEPSYNPDYTMKTADESDRGHTPKSSKSLFVAIRDESDLRKESQPLQDVLGDSFNSERVLSLHAGAEDSVEKDTNKAKEGNNSQLVIKVEHMNEIRLMEVTGTIHDLKENIKLRFQIESEIVLKFIDEDQDSINISTSTDLELALLVNEKKLLKLHASKITQGAEDREASDNDGDEGVSSGTGTSKKGFRRFICPFRCIRGTKPASDPHE